MRRKRLTVNKLSSDLYQVLNPDKVADISPEAAEIIRNESVYLNDSVVVTKATLGKVRQTLRQKFSFNSFHGDDFVTVLTHNYDSASKEGIPVMALESFMQDTVFMTQFEFMGYIFNGMKKFAEENGLQFAVQKLFSVTYEISKVSEFVVSDNPYDAVEPSTKVLVSVSPTDNPLSETRDKTLPGVFASQERKDKFMSDALNKILEGVSK